MTQKTAEPSTCQARTTTTTTEPTTQKEEKATEPMGNALDTSEGGERLLQNTLGRANYK